MRGNQRDDCRIDFFKFRFEPISRIDRSPIISVHAPLPADNKRHTMSSSDSSLASSFFSSLAASGAAASPPAAAAGAPPAVGAPPPPTLVRRSLTSFPSRALARREAQIGSTSTLAAEVRVVIFSPWDVSLVLSREVCWWER